MGKTLISASGSGPDSNCGYSGTVPTGEEWYVVRTDSAWGPQGEFLVGSAGQVVTVTQCHEAGVRIGYVNGAAFHFMRKYAVDATYDCINGVCIQSSEYDTPGIYASLQECQTACGNACTGVCVSNSDWATIKGLADKLKQKNCS